MARQVDRLAAAGQAQQPATQATGASAAPSAFWVQVQDTVLGLAEKEQQLFESAAKAVGSGSRALAAKAAAGLAALWALLGPDAMSLLPVMFVTAATAAAGLLLAASIAGVAGLVDKRRGGSCETGPFCCRMLLLQSAWLTHRTGHVAAGDSGVC